MLSEVNLTFNCKNSLLILWMNILSTFR
jgi:hypothetical protein